MPTTTVTKARKKGVRFQEPLPKYKGQGKEKEKEKDELQHVSPSPLAVPALTARPPERYSAGPGIPESNPFLGYAHFSPPTHIPQIVVRGFEVGGQAEGATSRFRRPPVPATAPYRYQQPNLPPLVQLFNQYHLRTADRHILPQAPDPNLTMAAVVGDSMHYFHTIPVVERHPTQHDLQASTRFLLLGSLPKSSEAKLAFSPVTVAIIAGRHETESNLQEQLQSLDCRYEAVKDRFLQITGQLPTDPQLEIPMHRFDNEGLVIGNRISEKMVEIYKRGAYDWRVRMKPKARNRANALATLKWETAIVKEDMRRSNALELHAVVELFREQREQAEQELLERVLAEVRMQKIIQYKAPRYWDQLGLWVR